ncbi:unnamed protein product [Protopolystoma xenopodis]|uniref:Lactate/malate dehydrogenase C-terminal domain-containing protein n=1 Tax=Protopolystoma xenopodis TaxID=117903 RepID=A0A3S5B167_9PLAT|nr:unnamed protein product [Protopolystoma xenopodis]
MNKTRPTRPLTNLRHAAEIRGVSNCPYYAKVELLADELTAKLPDFRVHKIVKNPEDWQNWIQEETLKNKWTTVKASPVVWRELVDRGGPKTLLGGANEFLEYAMAYFNAESLLNTDVLMEIAKDNVYFEKGRRQKEAIMKSLEPMHKKVAVFGIDCESAYHFLSKLAIENVFPNNEPIELSIYSDNFSMEMQNCLNMELLDMASVHLRHFEFVKSLEECVAAAELIIMFDVIPRETVIKTVRKRTTILFEERSDWLQRRYLFLVQLSEAIRAQCNPTIKVLITGNPHFYQIAEGAYTPINFDVTVLAGLLENFMEPRNVFGLSKPLERIFTTALARQLKVRSADVSNVVVWGNAGGRMEVDTSRSQVYRKRDRETSVCGPDWFHLSADSMPCKSSALRTDIVYKDMKPGGIRSTMKSLILHSECIISLLSELFRGPTLTEQHFTSLVTVSNGGSSSRGEYSVPEGLAFSFPVVLTPASCWAVVKDFSVDEDLNARLKNCAKEILKDLRVLDIPKWQRCRLFADGEY